MSEKTNITPNVRLVQLTEDEAKRILQWTTGPEIAGLQPTNDEIALATKMREVLASFAAGRTLTMEEVDMIRRHRGMATANSASTDPRRDHRE